MLFMGQELATSKPFAFFADQEGELGKAIRDGRKEFMRQFRDYGTPAAQDRLPDPTSPATFQACKLDPAERGRTRPTCCSIGTCSPFGTNTPAPRLDGAVLSEHAFVIRWFDDEAGDRLLLINLGEQIEMAIMPEPLLAPPRDRRWQQVWSSDDCTYGGPGAVDITRSPLWVVPAESAVLLTRAEQ